MAHVPPAARHLRAAAGRRPDDPHQDPAGPDGRPPGAGLRRRGRALVARLRPHHHPAEHAVPLRPAEGRAGAARPHRGGRPDDARGVRQLGPQHHDQPLRRRPRRRGVRRDAVRRGADPLLPRPSPEQQAAAQVQDRVRGLRRRSHLRRDQRHRLVRADQGRRPRLPRHRRRRHVDDDAHRRAARAVRPGQRDVQRRRGHRPRLPQARRLPAQGPQPDEVAHQVDRVGSLRRGIPPRADRVPRRGRRDAALRSAEPAGRGRARLAAGRAAERARHHHARQQAAGSARPRHRAGRAAGSGARARR